MLLNLDIFPFSSKILLFFCFSLFLSIYFQYHFCEFFSRFTEYENRQYFPFFFLFTTWERTKHREKSGEKSIFFWGKKKRMKSKFSMISGFRFFLLVYFFPMSMSCVCCLIQFQWYRTLPSWTFFIQLPSFRSTRNRSEDFFPFKTRHRIVNVLWDIKENIHMYIACHHTPRAWYHT